MVLKEIYKLLETGKICVPAACFKDKPHLSLMNFTYQFEGKNIVVITVKIRSAVISDVLDKVKIRPAAGQK